MAEHSEKSFVFADGWFCDGSQNIASVAGIAEKIASVFRITENAIIATKYM